MNMEALSEQTNVEEPPTSLPFPKTRWGRVLYGIYVTVFPILAFWSLSAFKPDWQSGAFSDYLTLLLFPGPSLVFLLLLAYSIISYLFLLISPAQDARLSLVRFGVYTGTLLALQYSILSILFFVTHFPFPYFILIWIFPLVYWVIYRQATAKWTAQKVNRFLFIVVLGSLLITGILTRGSSLFFVLMALTAAAPFWSLLLSLRATVWLFKNYEGKFSLSRGLGIAGWFAAYAAAWRFDILKMYELYAALPPTPPPDCYIATAAARGHPQFVRSWTVQRRDGSSMQVNTQLQRLKCAELALLALHPGLHRKLRKIYDKVGKALAHHIQRPWVADAAYLLLKPWEWLAALALKLVLPNFNSISSKMYTK